MGPRECAARRRPHHPDGSPVRVDRAISRQRARRPRQPPDRGPRHAAGLRRRRRSSEIPRADQGRPPPMAAAQALYGRRARKRGLDLAHRLGRVQRVARRFVPDLFTHRPEFSTIAERRPPERAAGAIGLVLQAAQRPRRCSGEREDVFRRHRHVDSGAVQRDSASGAARGRRAPRGDRRRRPGGDQGVFASEPVGIGTGTRARARGDEKGDRATGRGTRRSLHPAGERTAVRRRDQHGARPRAAGDRPAGWNSRPRRTTRGVRAAGHDGAGGAGTAHRSPRHAHQPWNDGYRADGHDVDRRRRLAD